MPLLAFGAPDVREIAHRANLADGLSTAHTSAHPGPLPIVRQDERAELQRRSILIAAALGDVFREWPVCHFE